MAGGRPKENLDTLPENWYNDILELYQEGASDVEIKAWIWKKRGSFSDNLWIRWMSEEEEFWSTIKMGRILAEAWWTKTGRIQLENKDFSFTGWYMQMKNRFSWKDKSEGDFNLNHSGGTNNTHKINLADMTDEQLRKLAELQDILKK
ncbi:MAG: hypothetical protein ACRDBG_23610 [Waterburya sp.]